jgi:N-acetyl-beta-hexosaminidase
MRSIVLLLMLFLFSFAKHPPKELMERIHLVPQPQKIIYNKEKIPFPKKISLTGLNRNNPKQQQAVECIERALALMPSVAFSDKQRKGSYVITFKRSNKMKQPEGYRLVTGKKGCTVTAGTAAGELYGAQTLCQILTYAFYGVDILRGSIEPLEKDAKEKKYIPILKIEDHPYYKIRSFMIDPGRAPYTLALTKRIIRIMAQLKLNTLHIHLFDDQLCGFKFATLPLGSENPYAWTPAEFREIVEYAKSYHIGVMPELESWGHVQSIIYHYPELYGTEGMWGGSSFAIGEKTYVLLEKMYDEIISLLDDKAHFHVGLDEAIWTVMPGEEKKGHSPTTLVKRIYEIVQRAAKKHKKKITMHLWADHGGRPLPKGIEDKVVIEPWKYRETDEPKIIKAMKQYGGKGKTPVMMGAGISSVHFNGDYEATRIWCREGLKYPNVLGVTLCLWESNDFASRILTLYGGAQFAWTPKSPVRKEDDPLGENQRNLMTFRMRMWQRLFPDADPRAIDADRGPEVVSGKYMWPPLAGRPVAPTADYNPKKDTRIKKK